jgi:hypothetical protein
MSWFPGPEESENGARTVPHLTLRSNTHGKSIMIDPQRA